MGGVADEETYSGPSGEVGSSLHVGSDNDPYRPITSKWPAPQLFRDTIEPEPFVPHPPVGLIPWFGGYLGGSLLGK